MDAARDARLTEHDACLDENSFSPTIMIPPKPVGVNHPAMACGHLHGRAMGVLPRMRLDSPLLCPCAPETLGPLAR